MKCSLLTLSCALDGELSRERQAELDAHLITCDRCKTGMRYLREETERISLLAQVHLPDSKATALLERSRVLGSPSGGPPAMEAPPLETNPVASSRVAPDPFGAMGLDAAILEVPEASQPAPPPAEPELQPLAELDRQPEAVAEPLEAGTAGVGEPAVEMEAGELSQEDSFTQGEAELNRPEMASSASEDIWLLHAPTDPQSYPDPAGAHLEPPRLATDPPFRFTEPPADEGPVVDARPDAVEVPVWEPATELKVPWAEIPAAMPAFDAGASDLTGVPVGRHTSMPPPAPFPAAPPTRPAAASVPGLQADRGARGPDREVPRRSSDGGARRPARPPSHDDGPQARSWTRTGLVAVAALALVLILWNVLHSGAKPSGTHPPVAQATISATPSPSSKPTPTPTAAATPLALTGVQTLGSTGSGYQVSSVQYGVHGSQLWVVFQFAGGSGVPQITAGFDGPQTIYLEMQGVAPGTQVAQPAAGSLVSSISIGHVSGFSGAVYVLQLSRAAQLSPSELTGNETGAPGYLAILQ